MGDIIYCDSVSSPANAASALYLPGGYGIQSGDGGLAGREIDV